MKPVQADQSKLASAVSDLRNIHGVYTASKPTPERRMHVLLAVVFVERQPEDAVVYEEEEEACQRLHIDADSFWFDRRENTFSQNNYQKAAEALNVTIEFYIG